MSKRQTNGCNTKFSASPHSTPLFFNQSAQEIATAAMNDRLIAGAEYLTAGSESNVIFRDDGNGSVTAVAFSDQTTRSVSKGNLVVAPALNRSVTDSYSFLIGILLPSYSARFKIIGVLAAL